MEIKKNKEKKAKSFALVFIGRTLFYTVILLALIYMYHYSQVGGGNFIYNQF